jgi:hypothetical protein
MEIVFGFLGVLVGSAIPWIKEEWHRKRSRQENGQFFAVRIASVLDEYAQKCVAVVGDDGTSEGRPAGRTEQGEEYRVTQASTPEPPVYPDDIDWRSIPVSIMYRALALPNAAGDTDRYISHSADVAYPPDFDELFNARQEGYARLGLEALSIADDLRDEFLLPADPRKFYNLEWNTKQFFEEKVKGFQKRCENDEMSSGKAAA